MKSPRKKGQSSGQRRCYTYKSETTERKKSKLIERKSAGRQRRSSRELTIGSGRKVRSWAQRPGSQGKEETILEAERQKRRQGEM